MNQENAYSKGCEVKYLLKSKTSVDLVDFNSQSPLYVQLKVVQLGMGELPPVKL